MTCRISPSDNNTDQCTSTPVDCGTTDGELVVFRSGLQEQNCPVVTLERTWVSWKTVSLSCGLPGGLADMLCFVVAFQALEYLASICSCLPKDLCGQGICAVCPL